MVAGVGCSDIRVFSALAPVKLTGLNNDTAESGSVTADELGSGMNHDICAMLDRTDEIRCSEGIIHNDRKSVLMCDLCYSVDIRNITVRISEGFKIDGSGILLDRALYLCQIMCIHKCGLDAILGKCVCQKVVASAVNGLLCYDMTAVCGKSLNGIGDGCRTAGQCQSCGTAFQCCQSLLQHILCGVGQSSVDISRIRKTEAVCCMLTVPEHIGGCLINGDCAGIRSRIRLFLTYVQLKCFESVIAHFLFSFYIFSLLFLYCLLEYPVPILSSPLPEGMKNARGRCGLLPDIRLTG